MTDMPATARFALPLLALAQAQKETTHNEALTLVDALVHAAVEGGPQTAPPLSPMAGQSWLVAAGATEAWSDKDHSLALWTTGGWRFMVPRTGMRVLRLSDGAWLRFDGAAWIEPGTVASPAGGTAADSEARAAIDALIAALVAHGLLI